MLTTYETKEHEEYQYLNLVKRIIETGQKRQDRTGTGIISIFAPPQLRFSLAENTLPLLTTKRTFIRPIFEELLWFIQGKTDSKVTRFLEILNLNRFCRIKMLKFGMEMVQKNTWIVLVLDIVDKVIWVLCMDFNGDILELNIQMQTQIIPIKAWINYDMWLIRL